MCPKIVVREYIEILIICEIRTEFLQILNVDFLRIPSVPDFDFLHFELGLTSSLT